MGGEKMRKNLDTFERWEHTGILKEKLLLIETLASKNVTQREIAKRLGISEKTLQKMKNKHVEFARAFALGNHRLKDDLLDAIFKKATGFFEEDVQTFIEEVGGKQKRKVVKNKKYYPPDLNSARYLLIVKFGKEFHDKRLEIEMMEKRLALKDEEWMNPNE